MHDEDRKKNLAKITSSIAMQGTGNNSTTAASDQNTGEEVFASSNVYSIFYKYDRLVHFRGGAYRV